jgi:ACS family tartrate transporter-like MFS transporter
MANEAFDRPDAFADRLTAWLWRRPADGIAERTRRRVIVHLLPWLFFLYILAFLDRVNVSVAGLGMMEPVEKGGLGFSPGVVGFGFGLFFWGYWILEVPSTLSVVRWGARWVFVRILVLWGVCSALVGLIGTPVGGQLFAWLPQLPEHTAAGDGIDRVFDAVLGWAVRVRSPEGRLAVVAGATQFVNGLPVSAEYQFYFFRFLLGFFEGGFFPSVIVYLTLWFRPQDRARAIATFMSAIPVSSVIGYPLSAWILDHVNWFDLAGWRWILILEGIAPILAGFATLFFLPDRPSAAAWLPPDERAWLAGELEREAQVKTRQVHAAWFPQLGTVLLLTAYYFCINVSSYGLSSFMPAIIKEQLAANAFVQSATEHLGISTSAAATYVGTVAYVLAATVMLFNGRHSDRTNERVWHAAVPLTLLSLGVCLTAVLNPYGTWSVVALILAVGPFMYAQLPAFWPLPSVFLGSLAAASAIGFINMIGNLGGSVGPWLVGKTSEGTGFRDALWQLAPWSLGAAGIIVTVGLVRRGALKGGRG